MSSSTEQSEAAWWQISLCSLNVLWKSLKRHAFRGIFHCCCSLKTEQRFLLPEWVIVPQSGPAPWESSAEKIKSMVPFFFKADHHSSVLFTVTGEDTTNQHAFISSFFWCHSLLEEWQSWLVFGSCKQSNTQLPLPVSGGAGECSGCFAGGGTFLKKPKAHILMSGEEKVCLSCVAAILSIRGL